MKLIKLLYYVDREALRIWGRPVSTDRYVSMTHGPVLSRVLNLITEGEEPGREGVWARHISEPIGNKEVKLLADPGSDELSRAEEDLITSVFKAHGHKNRWRIVDEIHELPEWKDPLGSAIPIDIIDILQALGKTAAEIAATEDELQSLSTAELLLQPL
jgi:uncharacterized phage-associated protein